MVLFWAPGQKKGAAKWPHRKIPTSTVALPGVGMRGLVPWGEVGPVCFIDEGCAFEAADGFVASPRAFSLGI